MPAHIAEQFSHANTPEVVTIDGTTEIIVMLGTEPNVYITRDGTIVCLPYGHAVILAQALARREGRIVPLPTA